ncbi:IS110 family transposase [Fischerella sp. PCC 9605]|uniref:IS110 family transposase n=1 Tax=Fischerella sp. PCC 9605 TaxID=1173024 RepID=UPI0004B7D16E|nr:IS110 family transposase [Fischerella sp. PCC 9605]
MNTNTTGTTYQLYVGVDISAATATVAWMKPGNKVTRPFTINQTPQGYTAFQKKIIEEGFTPASVLVVMEATGAYWICMATELVEAGFVVSVINPACAHHFAKALLKRAKTDAIDAQTLAQLARLLQPEPWTPPPLVYHELQQRLHQRETLLCLQRQVSNQLHALQHNPVTITAVRSRMEALVETLKQQLKEVDAEIQQALNQDQQWAASAVLLQSIKGIGWLTAAWVLVTTLNFTTCETAEAVTAYAGLAPTLYQSGSSVWHKPAIGHTGQIRLRTALYLATLSAAQSNPVIKSFYDRLRAAGKPMKVARCAAARKLLHIAWAVVKKRQPFDQNYALKPQTT